MANPSEYEVDMEQATEEDTTRVTPDRARDIVRDLRDALAAIGIPPMVVRQILPTADSGDRPLIRMGTWDLASAVDLTAALSAHRPPLIGRVDLPPMLPPTV